MEFHTTTLHSKNCPTTVAWIENDKSAQLERKAQLAQLDCDSHQWTGEEDGASVKPEQEVEVYDRKLVYRTSTQLTAFILRLRKKKKKTVSFFVRFPIKLMPPWLWTVQKDRTGQDCCSLRRPIIGNKAIITIRVYREERDGHADKNIPLLNVQCLGFIV